ncbi:hypothetical protein BGW39_009730 [Mortierella sp. 14UC]|nr:hypothetical protein BGW39_009730 [Mortierella sp. 14UC]
MSSASLYYTPSATTATALKPRTASTKRRVRFTFGYSSRTPSFGSLPPSPTTDRSTPDESSPSTASSPSSTVLTSTSLPIMHMPTPIDTTPSTYTYNSRPTADDLTATMIPTRTSSITSTSSTSSNLTPTSSRPASGCSSINSGFSYNGSLDHRTMRSIPSSSGHKSNSSISSFTTMPASATTTAPERPASPASPSSGRRPSVVERSAFLASAPVRSRAQIYPRLKNMCPAPSTLGTATTTFFTNTSLPSLTTRCFSNFQTSTSSCCLLNPCGVSLEKRRWSNDSTRGLYGGIDFTSSSSSGTLSFLSNDDGRTSTSSSSSDPTFNEEKVDTDGSKKRGRSDKKKLKKPKKPCPSLALFSFMLKK